MEYINYELSTALILLLATLNINSRRNKIVDVREILTKFSPDYFVLAETKLDESFPTGQFYINNYEIRVTMKLEFPIRIFGKL